MLDNTARQLAPQLQPPVAPRTAPTTAPQPNAQNRPQVRLKWSPFERLLACSCGVLAVALSLLYLANANVLANGERTYQDIQVKITKQTQRIDDYKQAIGELSQSERLTKFAADHGLTVANNNIKRVDK